MIPTCGRKVQALERETQNGATMLPTRLTMLPLPTATDLRTQGALRQQRELGRAESTGAQRDGPPAAPVPTPSRE